MQQVDAVGDPAQLAQWLGRQPPLDRPRLEDHAQQEDRGEGVDREAALVEPRRGLLDGAPPERGDQQHHDTDAGHEPPGQSFHELGPGGQHHGEERPGQQLHRPGLGAVVHPSRVGPRGVEGDHGHRGQPRQRPEGDDQDPPGPPPHGQQARHQQREEQVELLLDRQRPEVLDGRRGGEQVGVGLVGEDEPPVGHVRQGGQDVAGQLGQLVGGGDERPEQQDDAGQGQQGRRHQASEAPPPERPQRHAARPAVLSQEQGGDQETRQGEEGRDAEVAADGPREPAVEEEHPGHRQPAESVDRRLVRECHPARRRARRRPAGPAGQPRHEATRTTTGAEVDEDRLGLHRRRRGAFDHGHES